MASAERIEWALDTLRTSGFRFPNDSTPAQVVATWHMALEEVSDEGLTRALKAFLQSGERFFPTPGLIINLEKGTRPRMHHHSPQLQRDPGERILTPEEFKAAMADIRARMAGTKRGESDE